MFSTNDDYDDEIMSEINMTPLVDVMLVLLIIFMITVPVITQSVPVDLPQANNEKTIVKPDTQVITIDAQGALFWQEQSIDLAELTTLLKNASIKKPQPVIHIHGDTSAEYQHIIKVMAAVKKQGIKQMAFITLEEQ